VKASELRELTVDELETKVRDLSDQIFRMRLQKSMGQLEAAHKVQATRRDLARVKTILRQKGRPRAAG
jgi:large subunit ribosomal protein L29